MQYLISILPILVYFLIIRGLDGFSLARWNRMGECLAWGIMSCVICFLIGRYAEESECSSALIEEMVKCLPLIVAIVRGRSAFLSESIIYGSAVGAGFAILENILYIRLTGVFTTGDAIIRGFGTSLLHIGCSALFASVAILMLKLTFKRNRVVKVLSGLVSVIPAFGVHFLYNMFLLPEFYQMFVTVFVIWSIIYLIYRLDDRMITSWLDMCISNDIALLTAIKKGQLHNTNAGHYLEMAKTRFQPEVFFDIICYLSLYLDLTISAKSRMLVRESGLDIPLSAEQHKTNRDKILELASLKKNIGMSGLLFLNPFVNRKAVDDWVIKELL